MEEPDQHADAAEGEQQGDRDRQLRHEGTLLGLVHGAQGDQGIGEGGDQGAEGNTGCPGRG